MNQDNPDLEIRLEGNAIGRASVPVSHVLTLMRSLSSVLKVVSRANNGSDTSIEPKQYEIEFNLVSLKEGSVAAVLGLDLVNGQPTLFDEGVQHQVLQKTISGLSDLQTLNLEQSLPSGYSIDVLHAWLKLNPLFKNGVSQIQFKINGSRNSVITKASITKDNLAQIKRRTLKQSPSEEIVDLMGKLLMVDLGKESMRLEIYPSNGNSIRCYFNESLQYVAANNITKSVRVRGKVINKDAVSGEIKALLAEKLEPASKILPRGESKTLEDLAREQNYKPITDLSVLKGTWPGDLDDGFEELIYELRQRKPKRD